MDYKKKLETIINSDTVPLHDIDILAKYFPELVKSEDEKMLIAITKGIHDAVGSLGWSDFGDVSIDDILAWLEKQKEQKPIWSEENQNMFAKGVLTNCASSFIDYLDSQKPKGKMCVSNGECEDIENAFHNSMWDRLHRYYCKYVENQSKQNAEQKPTTWSKEDEKMFDLALDMIEWYIDKNEDKTRLVSDWLKSLKCRIQPK